MICFILIVIMLIIFLDFRYRVRVRFSLVRRRPGGLGRSAPGLGLGFLTFYYVAILICWHFTYDQKIRKWRKNWFKKWMTLSMMTRHDVSNRKISRNSKNYYLSIDIEIISKHQLFNNIFFRNFSVFKQLEINLIVL